VHACCGQVAAEMRVLTDAKARSKSLVEQLGGQVEEAQVFDSFVPATSKSCCLRSLQPVTKGLASGAWCRVSQPPCRRVPRPTLLALPAAGGSGGRQAGPAGSGAAPAGAAAAGGAAAGGRQGSQVAAA
jgi:hypothetical protein